jgi:hypothetical protein
MIPPPLPAIRRLSIALRIALGDLLTERYLKWR